MEQQHGILILNKPKGLSSAQCLSRIKRLGQKKIGHAGTLDPMATGVLIVMLGHATKLSNYLLEGGVNLDGVETPDGVIEVTLFDDILATGGTAVGMAERLSALTVERDGVAYPVKVKEFVFMGEIEVLEGRARLEAIAPVKSLIKF